MLSLSSETDCILLTAGGHQQQARAMLALVGWLQLYLLADPASMELDVAADLQGVFAGAFTQAKDAQGRFEAEMLV